SVCMVATDAGKETVGSIGNIHWLPGHENDVANIIRSARQWLSDRAEQIYAPFQPPMQVLGAGVLSPYDHTEPFLEPRVDARIRDILVAEQFHLVRTNPYELRPLVDATDRQYSLPDLTFRSLRREALEAYFQAARSAINEGIGNI